MFDSSDGIFGHRMVHSKLAAAGIEVSVGTVAVTVAENGWAEKRGSRTTPRKSSAKDQSGRNDGERRSLSMAGECLAAAEEAAYVRAVCA